MTRRLNDNILCIKWISALLCAFVICYLSLLGAVQKVIGNSRNNLYAPKCCCGVPVVKACSVFAIINAVLVGLMILGCLASVVLVAVKYASGYIVASNRLMELIAMILIGLAFYVGTIISAIFATLLLIGIRKKKHKFLKAYLIYGIIVEVALIFSTFVYIGFKSQDPYYHRGVAFFALYGSMAICICILYGFMVQLVYITYVILKNSHSSIADVQTLCLSEVEGTHFETTMPA